MKIRNIIILTVAVAFFTQCKKDPEGSYPNRNIVMDNAKAASYFHTVFREAENAWGFVDSVKYVSGAYEAANATATSYKTISYDETVKKVSVTYNAWVEAKQLLMGTIYFTVEKNVYRPQNTSITAVITAHLTDFSIEQQSVTGSCRVQYKYDADNPNDHYTCTLLDGSAIYEAGVNMPVIISGAISGGQYERTTGSATYTQKDDEWAYVGTMTGMLRDDPNMKYTNTVLPNGTLYFTADCNIAKQGVAQIKIAERADITYEYRCSEIFFESKTDNN